MELFKISGYISAIWKEEGSENPQNREEPGVELLDRWTKKGFNTCSLLGAALTDLCTNTSGASPERE